MSDIIEQENLISHNLIEQALTARLEQIAERIKQQGDKPYITVQRQLELLQQLSEFDFGRFLLQNQGINGFWTHYMVTHPWFGRLTGKNNRGEPFSEMESFVLDSMPALLATQERFKFFLDENQKCVKNGAKLASIPCGMMADLLYLDFDAIKNIRLFGIDYDQQTLGEAQSLAEKQGLAKFVSLHNANAWELPFQDEFDLISSNGLNIYEPDGNKVIELYKQFHKALKSGGKLVTSFMTVPPAFSAQCEWKMDKVNQADALLQKILLADIVEAKCQAFRSSAQTQMHLEAAGFNDITFIYDIAHVFPTVIAYK